MNSVSKLKIVLGYALLLAALLFSLLFVRNEVETLTLSDSQDVQWTDSLLTLLRKKDANTIRMLFFPFLIYQFGDGLQINFANALRGISDVKPMMLIAFISYFVISLPVGYFCGFVLNLGVTGVWMAFPFGLTSAGLMLWLRFRHQTLKK